MPDIRRIFSEAATADADVNLDILSRAIRDTLSQSPAQQEWIIFALNKLLQLGRVTRAQHDELIGLTQMPTAMAAPPETPAPPNASPSVLSFRNSISAFLQGTAKAESILSAVDAVVAEDPNQLGFIRTIFNRMLEQNKLTEIEFDSLMARCDAADRTGFKPTLFAAGPAVDIDNDSSTFFQPGTSPSKSPFITGSSSTGNTGGGDSQGSWRGLDSKESKTLTVGSLLKERFVLESIVGRGGMGLVFKARDLRKEEAQDRNPWVAVKVLNDEFKRHPESLKALQREARKSQNLAHPNIVTVFDFDRDGGNVYMTMEFMDGLSLDKILKNQAGKPFPPEEAMRITREMANALSYAHRSNIVHSDFKPGNVFINKDRSVKVFDFGIARASQQGGADAQGETTLFDAGTLGALTPAYASLEMLRGEEPDARDDIYAIACVAYELFTGRHPFNKKTALKALEEHLKIANIEGFSRAQMRGMLKGLALERSQRSPSVEQFVHGIQRKKLNKWAVSGAVVTASLVAASGIYFVPQYMEDQKLDKLVQSIRQGNPVAARNAISNISALNPESRQKIQGQVQDSVIQFIEKQITEIFNPDIQKYDYPGAKALIQLGTSLYQDSARLTDLSKTIESTKNTLINELDGQFRKYLADGKLLEDGTPANIPMLLKIIRQVEPNSPLLKDQRLAPAYLTFAKDKLAAKNYADAANLASAGLLLFADDQALLNIRDQINVEQKHEQNAERIAALTQNIDAAIARSALDTERESLRKMAAEIQTLEPNSPVLLRLQNATAALLEPRLKETVASRNWIAYADLLKDSEGLASAAWLKAENNRLEQYRAEQVQRIQNVLDSIVKAVARGSLEGAPDSAVANLAQLRALGADVSAQNEALSTIAQGFLKKAREARSASQWESARSTARAGLKAIAGNAQGEASLNKELADIAQAEQQASLAVAAADKARQDQARLEKVQTLRAAFDQILRAPTVDANAVKTGLQKLDDLASIDPANPILIDGRKKLGDHAAEIARAQAAQGHLADALTLAGELGRQMPDSKALTDVKSALEHQARQSELESSQQQLADARRKLEALLSKPEFTSDWQTAVRNGLQALSSQAGAAGQQGAAVADLQQQIARLYLGQIAVKREASKFAEAHDLLERGRSYAPDLAEWKTETQRLGEAEAQFEKANQEKAQLARIEGLKQTLATQVSANDLRNARKSLTELSKLIPNDAFVTTQAPQLMAGGYVRLAESAAKSKQFDNAIKLIQAGLEVAPQDANLQQQLSHYKTEFNRAEIVSAFAAPSKDSMARVEVLYAEWLKGLSPADAPAAKKELIRQIAHDLKALVGVDNAGVNLGLGQARHVFGEAADFSGVIVPTATPTEPSSSTSAPANVTPVAPPIKSAAPPINTAVQDSAKSSVHIASAAPCTAQLAGYGIRGKGVCYDMVSATDKGPALVVIPAAATGTVYAIGKYEVSFGDYQQYCDLSKKCSGEKDAAANLPVVGLSAEQMQRYASWLTEVTGVNYRLPTAREWESAAAATGKVQEKDFNCQTRLGGSLIRGLAMVETRTGQPNPWGLVNYVGNAQELVKDGSGFVARGGAYTDSIGDCEANLARPHSGAADKITGFRLVREMP